MIKNDRELEVTHERILHFERQVAQLRKSETKAKNYLMSAGGRDIDLQRGRAYGAAKN